jgi:hypothetical protein
MLYGLARVEPSVVDAHFSHLAQRHNLADYGIETGWLSRWATAAEDPGASAPPRPFPRLGRFTTGATSADRLSALFHTTRPVPECLRLFLRGSTFPALSAIAQPLAMRELHLEFHNDMVVPPPEIMAVASMTQLVSLNLLGGALTTSGPGFGFALQHLRHLHTLRFDVLAGVSDDFFARVGKWCPLLRNVSLSGTHDLGRGLSCNLDEPLYPHLTRLSVDKVTTIGWDEERSVISEHYFSMGLRVLTGVIVHQTQQLLK